MGAGQVFVFNVHVEAMRLFSVNGAKAGEIAAWAPAGGELPEFTPACLAVPRSADPAPGVFFAGSNEVIVMWEEDPFHFTLDIDGTAHPVVERLALFVAGFGYCLLGSYGTPLQSGPLLPDPVVSISID